MGATKIEFRLRMLSMAIIITLGFWTPWIEAWGSGTRIPLLEWLPLELSRHGLVTFSVATHLVILLAALIAAKAAIFRIWGAAFLGPATVIHGQMQAGALTASGPYRYVRNPLYLGLWAMTVALAFLMPPTGALFVYLVVPIFLLRLTLGEEAFLTRRLGQPYRDYLRAVPRMIPRLHTGLSRTHSKPQWLRAVLSEFDKIGIFFALTVYSWDYDIRLAIRVILIGFGITLVARALMPRLKQNAESVE